MNTRLRQFPEDISPRNGILPPPRKIQIIFGSNSRQFLFAKFLFFMLFGVFWTTPISAQVDVQLLASKAGITGTLTPSLSFRVTTETFYALPAGKSILNYDDYDKIGMEPSFSDEQVLYSLNQDDELIALHTVLDPSRQFRPQVYPYKHMLLAPDRTTFFDQNNNVIYTAMIDDAIKDTLIPLTDPRELTLPERIGFTDARLISHVDGVSKYEGDGYLLVIDEATGLVTVTYIDSMGGTEETLNMLFDFNNIDRNLPEYEMIVFSETLRSGECVFKVEMTSYSDYRDLTQSEGHSVENLNTLANAAPAELKVWPNPAQNILYLETSGWSDEAVTVWLMGLDGKLLIQETMDSAPTLRLNTNQIPAGTYILRAISGSQNYTSKIIIQ